MEKITLRQVAAVGFGLVAAALLIGAVALTALEVLVLLTVAPFDPERVARIFVVVSVAPVVGAVVAWKAASRVLRGDQAPIR